MKIIYGYLDTRNNNEDFAITPYLCWVSSNIKSTKSKIRGIGVCWGFYSIHISIGVNMPKHYPFFIIKNFPSNNNSL